MAERFLVAIDLNNLQDGLDLKTVSSLNRGFLAVGPNEYPRALGFLQDHFDKFLIYCDCTALSNLEQIISLLNSGATKVFVAYWQLKAIITEHLLADQDLRRLIVSITSSEYDYATGDFGRSFLHHVKSLVPSNSIGVHFHDVRDQRLLDGISQTCKDEGFSNRYVSIMHDIQDQYSKALKEGHVAIMSARELTTEPNRYPNLLPAHVLITAAMQSDRPDGLFSTIVSDQHGTCLGLVYSNEESIENALRLGCGAYHSRRRGLWIKGQDSGNTQELLSIALDCDADALQFTVRQNGPGKLNSFVYKIFFTFLISNRLLPSK